MYAATRIEAVEVLKPSSEIPIEPGDTWGIKVQLAERGITFALHRNEALALARRLEAAIVGELDASVTRWAREGKD